MARASTPTLLSLDHYAKILGITPVHFAGASAPDLSPVVWPLSGSCDNIWPQYSWQNADQVSREDLARAIHNAEMDIRRELGYSVAPEWIAQEVQRWPRPARPEWWGSRLNAPGNGIGFKSAWGKVIEAGRRATTLIDTATTGAGELVYSDEDGDTFFETATITVSTALTAAYECEVKVYFASKAAAPEWEIRPLKSVTIAGGTLTIVADSWLFIDPDLWEAFPTDDGFSAINISGTSNFVTSVDVYREYTDTTAASAQFLWERSGPRSLLAIACPNCGGSGFGVSSAERCAVCGMPSQDGCLSIRDAETGIVSPVPATYDSDDEQWNAASYTYCDTPAQIKMWYRAGEIDDRYLSGLSCEPLSEYWAQAIAWLATARLERPFCACNNVTALAEDLRTDLSKTTSSASYFTPSDVIGNPFGTRKGEVMAWQRVNREYDRPALVGGAI